MPLKTEREESFKQTFIFKTANFSNILCIEPFGYTTFVILSGEYGRRERAYKTATEKFTNVHINECQASEN